MYSLMIFSDMIAPGERGEEVWGGGTKGEVGLKMRGKFNFKRTILPAMQLLNHCTIIATIKPLFKLYKESNPVRTG